MQKKLGIIGNVIIIGLVSLSLYYFHTPSSINTVTTFDALRQQSASLDHNSLIIFDIDNTLLVDADPWEHGYRKERARAKTIQSLYYPGTELNAKLDRPTRDLLWSIYEQSARQTILDPTILSLILDLQKRSVKILGLTRFLVGKVGVIDSLENLRINQLKTNGFDFSSSFPDHNFMVFKQYSFEGKSPLAKNGILFTTLACSKGELLKAFLETIKWVPNKVIMFDDKVDQLKSVQEVLKTLHIPFEGFEYKGSENLPAHFDKNLAEFQMRYLIDHEQWLTGNEAYSLTAAVAG